MADTTQFFQDYLPKKLAANPDLQKEGGVFVFDITGAGVWTLDLGAGSVAEGRHDNPGCTITVDRSTWEGILDKPADAMKAFMTGKLRLTNVGMGMKLQKILA